MRQVKSDVTRYLARGDYRSRFKPDHIGQAVYSYIERPSKSLRPLVLTLSCGLTGGDELLATAAAAAVEVYHTWTLVHDDIIDRDAVRRGLPTVHQEFATYGRDELGYSDEFAGHYGLTIGILAGDVQQAWSTSLMCELHTKFGVDAELVLHLIYDLTSRVQTTLVEGETLDVQYSQIDIDALTEEQVLDMLWMKTGVLYEFAGHTGAVLGVGELDHPDVQAVTSYTSKCGAAFQLKDDVLGIVGDERVLGKPVGSDIREGKRTTILLTAMRRANDAQKQIMTETLGDRRAPSDKVDEVRQLLVNLGGIDYTMDLARRYVEDASALLDGFPDSPSKDLLIRWGEFILARDY